MWEWFKSLLREKSFFEKHAAIIKKFAKEKREACRKRHSQAAKDGHDRIRRVKKIIANPADQETFP